jgi:hypothetical protein
MLYLGDGVVHGAVEVVEDEYERVTNHRRCVGERAP